MLTDKYHKLRELGFSVCNAHQITPNGTAVVFADDLLAVIEAAPVVYGAKLPNGCWQWDEQPSEADTHVAVILGPQPIVRDSPEAVVRDLLKRLDSMNKKDSQWSIGFALGDIRDRARKLVSK